MSVTKVQPNITDEKKLIWKEVLSFSDIRYEKNEGIAKIIPVQITKMTTIDFHKG